MIDATNLPVLTHPPEALAPTPIPPETTITLPSGEVMPLRDIYDPRDAPPEANDEADEAAFNDVVAYLVALTEELAHTLVLHSEALNQILHGLTGPVARALQRKPKPKAKAKVKAKAKPKAKPRKRAQR